MTWMESATSAVTAWNDKYWLFMIALLVATGLYFCARTILVQIRYLPEMFRAIVEKPSDISEGVKGISSFKAFTISAASRVGTGNVAGVAVAISTGGPGAVFWMWLLAIIGGATSFVESTLAQLYKVKDKDSYRGGPAYYITRGLGEKWRWLAILFALAITVTYGFVFNAVQSNSITAAVAEESIQKRVIKCDDSLYYDMLSAFCKSLRGSDSDASLAWFARMTYAGVDPRIIVRRLIAHASEDVGLANGQAMLTCAAAATALEFVGMPEARLPIAQAIITVCESPKSNSVVMAIDRAMKDAEKGNYAAVPTHLRDTHYAGADRLGSGAGYVYPHEYPGHWYPQKYLPDDARGTPYYEPGELGGEERIRAMRKYRDQLADMYKNSKSRKG